MKQAAARWLMRVMLGGMVFFGAVGQMIASAEEITPKEEVRISIAPAVPERGGLLLRKGQAEIVPQLRYVVESERQFAISGLAVLPAIVIGTIDVEKTEVDILEASLTARYGILNDLQFEVKAPWRYTYFRSSETLGTDEVSISDNDFGDLEAGFSYQLFREEGARPAMVAAIRARSNTGEDPYGLGDRELPSGTGFWGVQGIINAVKVRDPVVLFGNISYTWNIEEEVDYTNINPAVPEVRIDPGNTIAWALGFAYALSPEFSLNVQYIQQITQDSKITRSDNPVVAPEGDISGSRRNSAELRFGTVWSYGKGTFIDFSIAVGMTDDAPDFTAQLGVPIRFNLF
jgi:hypothetical protein